MTADAQRTNGKRRGRGRSHMERPPDISQPVDVLSAGSPQGAKPACRSIASRGHRPPENAARAGAGSPHVALPNGRVNCPYDDDGGQIVWHRKTKGKDGAEGTEEIELANFKARIISDITRDDGVETVRHYEIAATLGNRPFRFEVPATHFGSMRWVHEHMGAGAVVAPGQGMQARLQHAILVLSAGTFEERHVYAHTGWREVDGYMYFLHAGGALGANGHRTDIDVDLPEQLARFELVEPEDDADLRRAVRKSLLLELLAPTRVMAPVLGAIYRAPLGGSDITVALNAPTGRGKTEMAAIAQQHFGTGMDARRLPLAWESTANVLEMVLSAGKDVLVTIDEYVPGESYGARSFLQAKAERVIRAQGNATGRGRMRADTSLRRVRPPRGQLLSTGEEVPTGQSLRARMMIVEVRAGEIDWGRMSVAQVLAADGTYATAMGGFIIWLASRLDEARRRFQEKRLEIRQEVQAEHKRTADVIAQLGAAWEVYLVFAHEIGALDEHAVDEMWDRVWAGLVEIAAEQSDLQHAAEPTARFRDLVVAALGTGKAHLASAETGRCPEDQPERWGWQRADTGWLARGECIGWVAADGGVYLEPSVSYTVTSKLGVIGVSAETLGDRLVDKGITVPEREGKRRRNRAKRTVAGQRRRVFHVRSASWLYPPERGAIGAFGAEAENTLRDQEVAGVACAPLR